MKLLGLALSLSVMASGAQAAAWMGSWAAAPTASPPAPAPGTETRRRPPSFDDQTIAQTIRLSSGGNRLRVRFTNEFGAKPLVIGAAHVVVLGADGAPVPGTDRELKFAGRGGTSVPPGAPMLSDPVDLPTRNLAILKISMYLPGPTPDCSCHSTGGQLLEVSPKGDFTQKPFESVATGKPSYRAFLSGVQVETSRPGRVVVALGDSLTDSFASTIGANRRYPDRLAERLIERSHGAPVAVVNAGITGNSLLSDGPTPTLGRSMLERFDRDVLSTPGVTHVIFLGGGNDIGLAGAHPPKAEDLIAGYEQLIARAHAHGLKIIGVTLMPNEGSTFHHPEGEGVRLKANDWIRTSGRFDAVVDFDALMRDPSHPARLKPEYESGDWAHPNDAGYRVMADAIDLADFR